MFNKLLWCYMRAIILFALLLLSSMSYSESIEYEIYDKASGKLVGNGLKEYTKEDIILNPYESGGRKVIEKFIELEQGYKVGARIFFDEKPLTGFGLVAQLTNQDFSWEWYNLENPPNTFRKLQGAKGSVTVRVSGLPMQAILEEVKFLDNATLGFALGGAGNEESHDIVIKKGSVFKFD